MIRTAGREHFGALVQPNHSTPVRLAKGTSDHARARRHVEHAVAGFRVDGRHERVAPAWILTQREEGRQPLVRRSYAGEELTGVLRARWQGHPPGSVEAHTSVSHVAGTLSTRHAPAADRFLARRTQHRRLRRDETPDTNTGGVAHPNP